MNLEDRLRRWDGKSADDIEAIYQSERANNNFSREIIRLAALDATQKGATWLLKHYLEHAGQIEADGITEIYRLCPLLTHWQSKLHLLQCMAYLPIPPTEKATVEKFVRDSLTHEVKFVRAWSYSGFYELARRFPEYQDEARAFFRMGLRDEPASVRARIRKVIQAGF